MEIRIRQPYLRTEGDKTVLCAPIMLDGQEQLAWFAAEKEYSAYLTDERLDAFVVGFLTTAMRQGKDIVCEAPLTKRLYYQLTQYLIPAMSQNMDIYHPISIHAPVTDEPLPCEGAVGTGWTGGVDSMYTLMHHSRPDIASHRLTHLLVANVGTLESNDNTQTLQYMADKARNGIALAQGLSVVSVDSNLQLLQQENYLAVAAFRLPAAVLALQKLFGVFLNSAGYEFHRFSFVKENSAYYELSVLSNLETDNTVFYSTGGQVSRVQKLRELSDFAPARANLHPCIYVRRENCCKCGKCVRTMGALYAMGKLDLFAEAFDIESFYQNKTDHLAAILSNSNSQHYGEIIMLMKQNGIPFPEEAVRKARIRRSAVLAAKKFYTEQ